MLAVSSTPTSSPAATAAVTLPRPPRTAQVKPFTASDVPMSYCVCVRGETTHPASAPMAAAMKNERVTRVEVRIPHNRAAVALEEHALIARPVRVNRKNRNSTPTMSAHAPSTQSTWGEMRAPSTAMEVVSLPDQKGRARTFSSQTCSAASRTRMERPMVMMITRRTAGFFSHEMKTSCSSTPTRPVMTTASAMAAGSGMTLTREMAIIPPSIRNSPWAKLMMPVEL